MWWRSAAEGARLRRQSRRSICRVASWAERTQLPGVIQGMKALRRRTRQVGGHIGLAQSPEVLRGLLPMLSARNNRNSWSPFHLKNRCALASEALLCELGARLIVLRNEGRRIPNLSGPVHSCRVFYLPWYCTTMLIDAGGVLQPVGGNTVSCTGVPAA